jgi:hypothetical protein
MMNTSVNSANESTLSEGTISTRASTGMRGGYNGGGNYGGNDNYGGKGNNNDFHAKNNSFDGMGSPERLKMERQPIINGTVSHNYQSGTGLNYQSGTGNDMFLPQFGGVS